MNGLEVFSETQRFRQWWLWVLLIAPNGILFYGIYQQIVRGIPFGDKPMDNTALIIVSMLVLLLSVSFIFLRLETRLTKDGVYVQFFPIHLSYRQYNWDTIEKSYVRKYNPILEYGGWGLRIGWQGKGKAFNVSGNMGLQLQFNNDKKLLIGTSKPAELEDALRRLGRLRQ